MNKVYLTDKQAAARYGLQRNSIWRWVREGHFPKPFKFPGGATRWNLADIEQWEEKQEGATANG